MKPANPTPERRLRLGGRLRRQPEPPPAPVVGPSPLRLSDGRRADEAVPFGLRVAAGISWRAIVVGVAAWGLAYVLAATSTVVIPVAVSVLFTALLMPVVVVLNHRLRLPRHLAALVALLGGIGLVAALLAVAGNQIFVGVGALGSSVAQGLNQIQEWLRTLPFNVGGEQLSTVIEQARSWVQSNTGQLTSGVLAAGSTAGTFVAGTLIALFVTFFFLAEGDQIWSWLVRLLPREVRSPVHEAFRRGWVTLGSYVKTQILVAAVDAVLIATGAAILGLPLVVPLALIIFFASAIPIVGAVVSGTLAVLLALVVKGLVPALIMLAIVLAVQQIEGNVLHPLLMSRAVALHPLATLLGVAVGSYLMGIVGALFAVPILAVANTVLLYLNGHDKFPALATADASALADSPTSLAGERPRTPDTPAEARGSEAEKPPARIGDADPDALEARQEALDARARSKVERLHGAPDEPPGRPEP